MFRGTIYLIFAFSPVGSHKLMLQNHLGSFVKWFRFNSLGLENKQANSRTMF